MSSFSGGGGGSACEAGRRGRRVLWLILVFTVGSVQGGEQVIGNFTQSPTNHEEVSTRNKDTFSPSISTSDDYWVGSHKLEFKPHPLLMPSTQPPTAQIPIPIIELGSPPTPTPGSQHSQPDEDNVHTVPLPESKSSQRKNRDRRKKDRDERRLVHRTLWGNGTTPSGMQSGDIIKSILQLQQHHVIQPPAPAPLILTAGSNVGVGHTSFLMPSANRNDESFHGSASTWNINHPNNLNTLGVMPQPHQQPQGQILQQIQLAPQPQPQYQSPFPIPSGPEPEMMMQQYNSQSTGPATMTPSGSSNGPILVYVPSMPQAGASTPVKAYSQNEIQMDIQPVKPFYGEPELHHHHNSGPNPQYFRNNILRVVMDKLAIVGKALPIPFVTKIHSHAHSHAHHHHHAPSRHHFSRRM